MLFLWYQTRLLRYMIYRSLTGFFWLFLFISRDAPCNSKTITNKNPGMTDTYLLLTSYLPATYLLIHFFFFFTDQRDHGPAFSFFIGSQDRGLQLHMSELTYCTRPKQTATNRVISFSELELFASWNFLSQLSTVMLYQRDKNRKHYGQTVEVGTCACGDKAQYNPSSENVLTQ